MKLALPEREARAVERLVFGCLAAVLAAFVLLEVVDAVRLRWRVDTPYLPRWFSLALLGLLAVPLLLSFALAATGSVPRRRRVRIAGALGLVALAAAVAPMTFFHAIAVVPTVAVGAALALAAPTARASGWVGGGFVATHAVVVRLWAARSYAVSFPSMIERDAWIVASSATLVVGFSLLATAYARGAAARGRQARLRQDSVK